MKEGEAPGGVLGVVGLLWVSGFGWRGEDSGGWDVAGQKVGVVVEVVCFLDGEDVCGCDVFDGGAVFADGIDEGNRVDVPGCCSNGSEEAGYGAARVELAIVLSDAG